SPAPIVISRIARSLPDRAMIAMRRLARHAAIVRQRQTLALRHRRRRTGFRPRSLHLLAQRGKQRLRAAAIALDDRGEFLAVRDPHADAVDIDVSDQEMPAAIDHMPVDRYRSAAAS